MPQPSSGMPDTKRSRPHQDRPATTAPLTGPVRVAPAPDIARMHRQAAAIFARVEADQRADGLMYQLGRADGFAAGFAAGEALEASLWSWALGIARRHALMVTHAELVRRRAA